VQKIFLRVTMGCVCIGLVLLALHGEAAEDMGPGQTREWVRFGVHVADAGTFDPHLAKGSQDRALADMLFNGLLRYVPGQAARFEPDLAEDFPDFLLQNNKQIWTFRLKQPVFFHAEKGETPALLTADDVVYSLRKAADPQRSNYAGEYTGMRFERVDAATVRIILDTPMSPLLFFPKISNYAGGFIISKQAVHQKGDKGFARHPVGSGPFQFDRHIPGEQTRLVAHDRYFRGKPQVRGVIVRYLPRLAQRESAFQSGQLDVYVGSGDPDWVEQVRQRTGRIFDVYGVGETMTLHLNTRKAPLDDLRVRRALMLALDREAFLRSTSRHIVEPVYAPVPEQCLIGGLSKKSVQALGLNYLLNPKEARELLSEAGYSRGFSLSMIVSEKRIYRVCAHILQEQLQRINVDCRIHIVPHHEMHQRIRNDEADLVLYGAWRPTADAFLSQFFHSDSIPRSGGAIDTNFSHYQKVDALIEDARQEVNPRKQLQLWNHAQIRILSDAVAYPLFSVKQNCVRQIGLDYGHPLQASMALYPQFTEKTRFID
jgi:peptide/nickel transport system substrate-binding protein